jgi:glutamate-1-semialdehyde 2,1-aminomutase
MPSLVVNYSHSVEDVEKTIKAAKGALEVYRRALDEGVDKYLLGRSVKPVFRRHV